VSDTSTTPVDSPIVINSFWDGERLTTLERVCISSFLHHGYAYELYVYDEPDGVVLRDAESILPRSQIFRYAAGDFNLGSIAGFSDVFRSTLIYKRGGWWADTDQCCVNRQGWRLSGRRRVRKNEAALFDRRDAAKPTNHK
jgi:hypothetical protein